MKKRIVGIIMCDKKILIVKRKKGDLDYYCLPGGTLEQGENILECLERELIEEISFDCKNFNKKHIITLNKKEINEESFYFYITANEEFLAIPDANSPEMQRLSADTNYEFSPIWFPFKNLNSVTLFPVEIKNILVEKHPKDILEIINI